jgi:hypothetical protein
MGCADSVEITSGVCNMAEATMTTRHSNAGMLLRMVATVV